MLVEMDASGVVSLLSLLAGLFLSVQILPYIHHYDLLILVPSSCGADY